MCFNFSSNKIPPFLFLFIELSAQFDQERLIRIRKTLPPGIHYMTGPNGRIRRYVTRETGPLEVLETREDGKILAIIDEFNVIREIRLGKLLVYVDLLNFNRTETLRQKDVQRYGIHFKEQIPPRNPRYLYQFSN